MYCGFIEGEIMKEFENSIQFIYLHSATFTKKSIEYGAG